MSDALPDQRERLEVAAKDDLPGLFDAAVFDRNGHLCEVFRDLTAAQVDYIAGKHNLEVVRRP